MKMEIIRDGSIQGWFVSFIVTMATVGAFVGSMADNAIAERFAKVGSIWAPIVLGQFAAWLAYKTLKKSDGATPPQG